MEQAHGIQYIYGTDEFVSYNNNILVQVQLHKKAGPSATMP